MLHALPQLLAPPVDDEDAAAGSAAAVAEAGIWMRANTRPQEGMPTT